MTPTTSSNPRKRVLFISYAFPPVGGAGVQRVTKFIKYLHGNGWDSSVLTVANPSVPVMDHTLTGELPSGVTIVRATTLEPGYAAKQAMSAGQSALTRGKAVLRKAAARVLQPDPQILWLPAAWSAARKLLRELPHDAVVASGPPFSSFLLGAQLSRSADLPLVLDYRDEWDLTNQYWENKELDAFSLRMQRWMQHQVVRRASALVATTRSSASALESIRVEARSTANVTCIYNGYDPADFVGDTADTHRGRFRLVYTGTLWNLMSLQPLVDAVRRLRERSPQLADAMEVVVAGRAIGAQEAVLKELGRWCRVVAHDYVDHAAAVRLMRSADALCITLSDLPGMDRWVPAKTFEYMAAKRPILALIPDGELRSILESHPHATVRHPGDIAAITDRLAAAIGGWRNGDRPAFAGWDPTGFDRPNQARQLAALLESVARIATRPALDIAVSRAGELA